MRALLVVFVTFLLSLVTLAEETEEVSESDYDVDKRGFSGSCRRCMHNSDDWGSCLECFSRPGPAPYYSGEKRASDPYDWTEDKRAIVNPYEWDVKRAFNPYEWNVKRGAGWRSFFDTDFEKRAFNPYDMEISKRGFSACRCCLKIRDPKCCANCNYAPYYTKRAYRTSYRPEYDEVCGCCRKDRFNYACCMNCSMKK